MTAPRPPGLVMLAGVAALALGAAATPALSPIAWTPDPVAPQYAMAARPLRILRTLPLPGPETCRARADGVLACGTDDGRIVLVAPDLSRTLGVLAETGGRPLGLAFDAKSRLIVADSKKGLLSIAPDGAITVLRAPKPSGDLGFPDDVVPHGERFWLSDASARNGWDRLAEEFVERRATGALYDLDARGRGAPVLRGLAFANGLALDPKGAFLLVDETSRSRVRRLWLKGPKAGRDDVFAKGLPGNPDNLAFDAAGRVWIALVTPRDPAAEALAGQPQERAKRFREAAAPAPGAPATLRPSTLVLLDHDGKLLGRFSVPHPELGNITNVTPTPAGLVLGTNRGTRLALAEWPVPPP